MEHGGAQRPEHGEAEAEGKEPVRHQSVHYLPLSRVGGQPRRPDCRHALPPKPSTNRQVLGHDLRMGSGEGSYQRRSQAGLW